MRWSWRERPSPACRNQVIRAFVMRTLVRRTLVRRTCGRVAHRLGLSQSRQPAMDNRTRVMVSGGGGFLGKKAVARLNATGVAEVLVPRSQDSDRRTAEVV